MLAYIHLSIYFVCVKHYIKEVTESYLWLGHGDVDGGVVESRKIASILQKEV